MIKRIFNYQITITQPNQTILDFLKSLGYSHGIITQLKRTPNGILHNNNWGRVRDKLSSGDILTITLVETQTSGTIIPIHLPFSILHEDEDLMVVYKPANMPIHPSQGNYDNTLANAVSYYYKQKRESFVYRCINRLDRDTSGLLILAKHAYSASLLSSMVSEKKIRREYLAIVTGNLSGSGTVEAPIGRVDGSTIERQVDFAHGDYAKTNWTSLSTKNGYTLVSLTLETGRTHQIRVHMKHIGNPLIGDFLYNPDYSMMSRQALHSHKVSFIHPITLEPLAFTADLPFDMKWILTKL